MSGFLKVWGSRLHSARRHECHVTIAVAVTSFLQSLSRHSCSRCHIFLAVGATSPCSRCHVTVQSLSRHRAVAVKPSLPSVSHLCGCWTTLQQEGSSSNFASPTQCAECYHLTQCAVLQSHTPHNVQSVAISYPTQFAECYNLIPQTMCSVTISQITQRAECYNLTQRVEWYDLTQRVECYDLTQPFRFPFSSKVVIYRHCLVALPLTMSEPPLSPSPRDLVGHQ